METLREMIAKAHRVAADALESGSFVEETCCGIVVDDVGLCQHRPGHGTLTNPDSWEIRRQWEKLAEVTAD